MKEKIIEIIKEYWGSSQEGAASEIDTLTRNHYMEFVEWFRDSDYGKITINDELYYYLDRELVMSTEPMITHTLTEIYEYWKDNIKK